MIGYLIKDLHGYRTSNDKNDLNRDDKVTPGGEISDRVTSHHHSTE